MSILYEDKYLICDDNAITIYQYYFPVGSKRIPYSLITKVTERSMDWLSGKIRIWGMDFSPEWFHFDSERPRKSRCIVIDEGETIKVAITPENHATVLEILREQISY